MKKCITTVMVAALIVCLLSGCSGSAATGSFDSTVQQLAGPVDGDTVVVFETSMGTFKAVLFPDAAPKAVKNFTELAAEGFYDGLFFHRVIADFLIQSGDDSGTGGGGKSVYGEAFPDEASKELFHFAGALCCAHSKADNNFSQFYVVADGKVTDQMKQQMIDGKFPDAVITAYAKHGGRPTLDTTDTVFGQVYEGLDVVKSISEVKTNENNVPKKNVTVKRVTVEIYKAAESN